MPICASSIKFSRGRLSLSNSQVNWLVLDLPSSRSSPSSASSSLSTIASKSKNIWTVGESWTVVFLDAIWAEVDGVGLDTRPDTRHLCELT